MRDPQETFVVFAHDDYPVQQIFRRAFHAAGGRSNAQAIVVETFDAVLNEARARGNNIRLYIIEPTLGTHEELLELGLQLRGCSPEAHVVVRVGARPARLTEIPMHNGAPLLDADAIYKSMSEKVLMGALHSLMCNLHQPYKYWPKLKVQLTGMKAKPGQLVSIPRTA